VLATVSLKLASNIIFSVCTMDADGKILQMSLECLAQTDTFFNVDAHESNNVPTVRTFYMEHTSRMALEA
jgi:hypothetical protein